MKRGEKKICTIPPIRCTESLELALLRLAARHSRVFSDYVRQVLIRDVESHGITLDDDSQFGEQQRASKGDAL